MSAEIDLAGISFEKQRANSEGLNHFLIPTVGTFVGSACMEGLGSLCSPFDKSLI